MPSQGKQNAAAPLSGPIRADELYTLPELCRRLGWREAAARAARRKGLPLISLGRQRFALGSDVIAFFQRLGEEQRGNGKSTGGVEGS